MAKNYDFETLLEEGFENVSQHFYDEEVETNAEFRESSGIKAVIRRELVGETCAWCEDLAGVYEYGKHPKDIFRRHRNCDCVVTYETVKEKVNVHTKEKENRKERIAFNKLYVQEENNRIRNSIEYKVEKNLFNKRSFTEKVEKISTSEKENKEFREIFKKILTHRSGTNGEDLVLYNRETGKWFKSFGGNKPFTPEYNKEVLDAIYQQRGQLIAFHNHPRSHPPSVDDINSAVEKDYIEGYILCHNGTIYQYTKPEIYIPIESYNRRYAKIEKEFEDAYNKDNIEYNEIDIQVKVMEYFAESMGFIFKEIK